MEKCVDGPVDCGLLHDLMSLEWGKFRDGFDELTAEMNQNQEEYDNTKRNINEEITVLNDQKTKHMEVLANTISAVNADTEEMNEKDQQKRDLQHEFDKTCTLMTTMTWRWALRIWSSIAARIIGRGCRRHRQV